MQKVREASFLGARINKKTHRPEDVPSHLAFLFAIDDFSPGPHPQVFLFIVRFLGNSSFVFILSREGAFQTPRVGLFGEGSF